MSTKMLLHGLTYEQLHGQLLNRVVGIMLVHKVSWRVYMCPCVGVEVQPRLVDLR
jgi:hypothetical protein